MDSADAGAGCEEPPPRNIPEDVVDEILIRLPSAASLARAAAACAAFRALVSSPRFLRRHRALHPDTGPLLGAFFSSSGAGGGAFYGAELPHPAAAAACAVAGAADFSFGFLPSPPVQPDDDVGTPHGWLVRDYRDGRFLLDRASTAADGGGILFTDLAICDPLSRRYVLLPPIPEDLAGAVSRPLTVLGGRRRCEPFLAPADGGEAVAEPSFAVIWTARCPRKVVALAFSSRDGRWRTLPSPDCFVWSRSRSPFGFPVHAVWNRRYYAHGCFYWLDCLAHRWLVLDTRAMELAVEEVPSPAGFWEEQVAVVEGADGKVGVFAHDFYHADGNPSLHYYTTVHDGGDGRPRRRWQLEKTIPLPWPVAHGRPYCIRGAANGCLILEVNNGSPAFMAGNRSRDVELFKIDVESFRLERICQARCAPGDDCWPYFGCPPLLSLPTV